MDFEEELNIFDDCDELFEINDVELCAGQTDDKEFNDLVLWFYFIVCKFDSLHFFSFNI